MLGNKIMMNIKQKYERENQHLLLQHTVTCLHIKVSVDLVGELWDKNSVAVHNTA
jgi:hypothetical protein